MCSTRTNAPRALLIVIALSLPLAPAGAKDIGDLVDDANKNKQGLGDLPSGEGPADGLVGYWGEGQCVVIESSYCKGPCDGAKKDHAPFHIEIVRRDGELEVLELNPLPNETFTYSVSGTHVHAENIRDQRVRGIIRDFNLEGKTLVGTYTTFDTYHKDRTVSRCELFWRQDAFADPPPR